MNAAEVNFDGLVGPTHNYGGLPSGNLASAANEGLESNPREAALQGIEKMRSLIDLGIAQAVLPPQERPHVGALRQMGFVGSDAQVIEAAAKASPALLAQVSSASAMWTANAATVSPSADTEDGRVHITPANMFSHFHRALETPVTTRLLRAIFADEQRFCVHDAVPFPTFGDEGAANHLRLARRHGEKGVEVFVYGKSAFMKEAGRKVEPRQAYEASQIIMTTHKLERGGVMLARQAQAAIDGGAFHNDVVGVSNESVLLFHEAAFEDRAGFLDGLKRYCGELGFEPALYGASDSEVTLDEAVSTYLFNSQIVTLPAGGMAMIAPVEAHENERTRGFIQSCLSDTGPLREAHFFDLRQSMRNGGGPACLRLRVVLTETEWSALGAEVLMDPKRLDALAGMVERHYRDRLSPADLGDPQLLLETRTLLDELTQVMGLGSIYDFQRT